MVQNRVNGDGLLLQVTPRESSERLTFTAPAQSINKSNQRLFARVPNQIMSHESGSGFNGDPPGWATKSCVIPLIGERVNVC